MDSTLSGHVVIPSFDTMNPKYSTCDLKNSDFSKLILMLASLNALRTSDMWYKCSSSEAEYIITSSIYTYRNFPI